MGHAVKSLIGASVGAALLIAVTVSPSHATAVTLTGTGTGGRSASVTFDTFTDITTTYLSVTLTNTAIYDSSRPSQILTAIFFSLPGNPTLSRTLGTGLSVSGYNQGISSTGVGLFGAGNRFITCSSCDLQGPDSPDGVQYGITTLNDPDEAGPGNDNGGLLDQHQIRKSVVFLLGGINAGFDPSTSITSVRFQDGTNLSEPHFGNGDGGSTRVRYPSWLALVGCWLVGC
jgi:hypothetical protein